jgi:carbonic anhydrase/acetyltransferase-like protein (isoleucine patch superfamily)
MTVYSLKGIAPRIAPGAYVAPNATVVGDVLLAGNTSVWFGATIRGDNELISIGAGSNVQDGATLHADPGFPTTIGTNVSIGHQAVLHGCTVGDGSLIGIHAVVLNGAAIGAECLVGAGAVVTERKQFEAGSLILGAPAKVVRLLTAPERSAILANARSYVQRAIEYKNELAAIDADVGQGR